MGENLGEELINALPMGHLIDLPHRVGQRVNRSGTAIIDGHSGQTAGGQKLFHQLGAARLTVHSQCCITVHQQRDRPTAHSSHHLVSTGGGDIGFHGVTHGVHRAVDQYLHRQTDQNLRHQNRMGGG